MEVSASGLQKHRSSWPVEQLHDLATARTNEGREKKENGEKKEKEKKGQGPAQQTREAKSPGALAGDPKGSLTLFPFGTIYCVSSTVNGVHPSTFCSPSLQLTCAGSCSASHTYCRSRQMLPTNDQKGGIKVQGRRHRLLGLLPPWDPMKSEKDYQTDRFFEVVSPPILQRHLVISNETQTSQESHIGGLRFSIAKCHTLFSIRYYACECQNTQCRHVF